MAHDYTRVYVVGGEGGRDEKLSRSMGTLFPCGKLSLLSLDVLLVNLLRLTQEPKSATRARTTIQRFTILEPGISCAHILT